LRQRETILKKISKQKLEMVRLEGIQKEVQDLTTNITTTADEDV